MDKDEVAEPSSSSPRLLRVPRPISAPSLFCPQGSEEHPDGKEREADARQLVDGNQLVLLTAKLPEGKKRSSTSDSVCKHVYDDMRHEPRALQGRHHHLVVYLRLQEVDADEDSTK